MGDNKPLSLAEFQSTLLMRGATRAGLFHRDHTRAFQSTLLMRGATWRVDCTLREFKFQSTLLMRGATKEA